MLRSIKKLLEAESVTQWGVCRFADTLPLLDCKGVSRLPENPKSIIVTLFPYRLEEYQNRNISKYAVVPDYHTVCTEKLGRVCDGLKKAYPENNFSVFADNSPIREVLAAKLSGLGAVGKNGLLINREYGSYVFIAEIVTDLEITASKPEADPCLECDLCVKACPAGAIEDGKVVQERCLSYITQKKGILTDGEEELIRKSKIIWGCDICSDVCPMNKNTKPTDIKEFCEDLVFTVEYPQNNKEIEKRAFGFRGAQVIRRNLDLLKQEGNR